MIGNDAHHDANIIQNVGTAHQTGVFWAFFNIHERIATMKNLTDLGSQALELTAGRAAHTQAAALGVLLKDLPAPLRFQVDEAVGAYAAALLEAGFLAGLKVAADPLSLLVE